MATRENSQKNEFIGRDSSAFVLDPTKLSRILAIIEERYTAHDIPFEPQFEGFLQNGKHVIVTELQALLSLDNAVRNPIRSLLVKVSGSSDGTSIDTALRFLDAQSSNIRLEVRSSSPKIASQLFAELEEQVERTFAHGWVHRWLKTDVWLSIFLPAAIFAVGIVFSIAPSNSRQPGITRAGYDSLVLRAEHAKTPDERLNVIFDIERIRLNELAPLSPSIDMSALLRPASLSIIIPLLVIVGCAAYVIRVCYPRAVFLWGDYAERYAALLGIRKTIWTVVVVSLAVGVMASLFATGLSSFFDIR